MGFLDLFRRRSTSSSSAVVPWGGQYATFTDDISYTLNGQPVGEFSRLGAELADRSLMTLSPADMWATQPHLRTVVSFLGRNIAQLGLHSFERVGETDRRRDRVSPVASLLRRPNPTMTSYELVESLVIDRALYDVAYWAVVRDADAPSGWAIWRLPPAWVTPKSATVFTHESFDVRAPGAASSTTFSADEVLVFHGYHPGDPRRGSSAVNSLRETLQESINAGQYRSRVWERGGKVSAVIERPAGAPAWSPEAANRFREDWRSTYTGKGKGTGGTPILEDGMKLTRVDFSASDQQYVEGQKLTLATVAAAFHINPTMVGLLDNANYSNVREFRRMLYGDTLGPLIASVEDRLNTFLLPMLGMDPARFYLEFNIAEKLQGSFEEQTAALSSSVGRPWMTADEARARLNLPALGGDAEQLVTPLNVLVGGQASPRDSGSQNQNAGRAPRVKAAPTTPERAKANEVLTRFFKRQRAVVLTALGSKAAQDWWDGERWDRELSADLLGLSSVVTAEVARRALEKAGGDPSTYDVDRTLAWLKTVTSRIAGDINATTYDALTAAIEEDGGDPADVFDAAEGERSDAAAITMTTAFAGFATTEAGRQSGAATKTWITGPNARPSHAAMSGETVGIDDEFSNGMKWPGDGGDADEVAGCNCEVSFDYP